MSLNPQGVLAAYKAIERRSGYQLDRASRRPNAKYLKINYMFYQNNLEPPGWKENLKLILLLLGVIFLAWFIFDYYNLGLPGTF